ncbi:MAG: hypothetical protein HC785_17855 [Calothrix sp. CSU_2_0]|nr:hypothetical protein [Calothrix sp. CSU_2_0]
MNILKISLFCLLLLGNIFLATEVDAKQQRKRLVRGNCGKLRCDVVVKQLRSLYPNYISKFEKECTNPKIFAADVGTGERNARQAWFLCWEAKREKNGTRYGSFLGTLPLPGNEAKFLVPLPSSSPYTQELQTRYPQEIKKAQFECATKSGNFNILESEEKNKVQLQCYFQAGAIPLDEDGDFNSDGEVSRGAGVDIMLGTFPVSGR